MPTRIRPFLVAAAAASVLCSFATAARAAAGPDPRLRAVAGPAPMFPAGSGPLAGALGGSPIATRGSRPTASGARAGATVGTTAPLAAVSPQHFDAIPRIGPNWPGDPSGAIGQLNIVTSANTQVAVYDRTGDGTAVAGPKSLGSFFDFPVRTQVFDPKVVYDQYSGRFVLAFLAVNDRRQRSWILVVTIPDASASDPSTWCGIRFAGDGVRRNGRQWADYPGLGYDSNSVTISTNAFGFPSGFAYAQLYHIASAELFAPCSTSTPVPYGVFAGAQTRDPDGTKAFTIQPATTVGTSNAAQFLLSYERAKKTSTLVVWRIQERKSGPSLSKVAVPSPNATVSPYGTQRGGSLRNADTWWDPGDLRLVNAFYDADRRALYAAHDVFRNLRPDTITGGYPEAAIRWYQVEPGRPLRTSVLQRTGIVGTAETDAGWPVVGTDASGNLFITYSRASLPKHEYLSSWLAEIPPGSRTPTLTLLTAGTARMEAIEGVERWGDFNGIARDPVDGSFVALVNQYAKSDGSGTTRDWQETFDLVTSG